MQRQLKSLLRKLHLADDSLSLTRYIATKIKDVSAIWKELLQIKHIHQIQYSLRQLALRQVSAQGTRQQEISASEVQDKCTYNSEFVTGTLSVSQCHAQAAKSVLSLFILFMYK